LNGREVAIVQEEATTKDLIIDTAEQLYANKGFAAVSLRHIIRDAGVNTAAVHYHFGSREALVRAVLERRAGPINNERLAALDSLEARSSGGTLPLEGVVEAFLAPVIRMLGDPSGRGRLFPRLMVWAILEPDPALRDIIRDTFGHVFRRFASAFKQALPGLADEEVFWRIHFMLGTMAFTVAVPIAHPERDTRPDAGDAEEIIARLVDFVTAGMRESAAGPIKEDHR
jgi:AcrR family transcriptional regulator